MSYGIGSFLRLIIKANYPLNKIMLTTEDANYIIIFLPESSRTRRMWSYAIPGKMGGMRFRFKHTYAPVHAHTCKTPCVFTLLVISLELRK